MVDMTVSAAGTDNCGIKSVTQSIPVETTLNPGVHSVSFTATDNTGNTATISCPTAFTVVDDEVLLESGVDCGITEHYNPPYWHFHPCDASSARPLKFKATTVAKKNGCPAAVTATAAPLCERCNGANKLQTLTCNGITTVGPDTLQIKSTNGVGNFIRWSVTAKSEFNNVPATKYCGICIETPNNNDGTGCLAGKTRHRNLRLLADGPFECPEDYPKNGELLWPGTSLSGLGKGCPF
jgi:hypothetical protein